MLSSNAGVLFLEFVSTGLTLREEIKGMVQELP